MNVRYEGTGYLPSRRTLSRVQVGETIFTRTSVLGRLVAFAAIGGVLAAAMVIPVVAATGVLVRNEADKFTTLSLSAQGLPQRSEILDRYGHLLAYVYGVDVPYYNSAYNAAPLKYFGWDRQPVDYAQIDSDMVNAVVAIEDSRYWDHGAIDLRGTIRAAVNDFQHKPVQGGSTIAQQYVKNVLLLEAEKADNSQAVQAAAADDAEPQAERAADGGGRRAPAVQAGHRGRLPERRLLRQFRLRDRGRRRDVLRHQRREAVGDPGRHPGRHRGEPVAPTIPSSIPRWPSSGATPCWPGWPRPTTGSPRRRPRPPRPSRSA